jgi:predicted TIM-barrel fold metal-dependent hydrolase
MPIFQFPSLSCDTHCHVIGPRALFPFAPTRAGDATADATKAMLAAMHQRLGIERAVIVQSGLHGTDPAVTLDAIATSQGRYRGVALVEPGIRDRELEVLHAGGIRGIRLNFVPYPDGPPNPADLVRLADRAADLEWHFLLHLRSEQISTLAGLLRKLRVPLVFDHLGRIDPSLGTGQPAVQRLLEFLADGNSWVKIAAVDKLSKQPYPFRDVAEIASKLVDAVPDRVIWGSDWPHPDARGLRHGVVPEDEDLAALVPSYAPDAVLQRKLLVENPARLYGFSDAMLPS